MLKLDLARAVGEIGLPDSLQDLCVDSQFIPPVPADLRSIRFGPSFNRPLDDMLWPASLTLIQFGERFNQRLQRYNGRRHCCRWSWAGNFTSPS